MFKNIVSRSHTGFMPRIAGMLSASVVLSACGTYQVHHDASTLRLKALDYYSDQIVDNLIRAKNGLFILHVDIGDLNATVKTSLSGTVGGGQTLTRTTNTNALGLLASGASAAMRPFTFSVTPGRDDTLAINTKPTFTDEGHVYSAYLQFLNLPKGTGLRLDQGKPENATKLILDPKINPIHSLVERDPRTPLNENEYIPGTLKTWGRRQYYIPSEYRQAYFDLCLKLVERGGVAVGAASKAPPSGKKPSNGVMKSQELKQLQQNERKLNQLRSLIQ